MDSALATINIGNNRSEAFTTQFSNVWLTPAEMMFRDTTLNSDIGRRDREARALIYRLEKNEEKQVKKFEKETK